MTEESKPTADPPISYLILFALVIAASLTHLFMTRAWSEIVKNTIFSSLAIGGLALFLGVSKAKQLMTRRLAEVQGTRATVVAGLLLGIPVGMFLVSLVYYALF